MNWTRENELAANKEGWGICTIWDPVKLRIECDVISKGGFASDIQVKHYVADGARLGNKLAIAATQAVFHSRLGATETTKKGKKK